MTHEAMVDKIKEYVQSIKSLNIDTSSLLIYVCESCEYDVMYKILGYEPRYRDGTSSVFGIKLTSWRVEDTPCFFCRENN